MAVVDRWKNSDGSPSTDSGRGKRWLVRYRDPQGKQRAKSFTRKADADNYALAVAVDVKVGAWADPKAGRQSFTSYSREWLASNEPNWKPTTQRSMKQVVTNRIQPHIGLTPMSQIDTAQVRALVNLWTGSYSPATVRLNLNTLRSILISAVEARVISQDVSAKVSGPKVARRRNAHLSHEQVGTILSTAREPMRPILATMAWCGLRIGEALGLDVADVDWLTGTAAITKQQSTISPTQTLEHSPRLRPASVTCPFHQR